MSDQMINKWAPWYESATEPQPYADTETYQRGADWLKGLSIEDRGCGYGWFKKFHEGDYQGVDGTAIFGAKEADLRTYRNPVEGIYMRHVLEHNYEWKKVLENALQDFTKRMVLVLFTPMTTEPGGVEIEFSQAVGVPDLSLNATELLEMFELFDVRVSGIEDLDTPTWYRFERVYLLEKV